MASIKKHKNGWRAQVSKRGRRSSKILPSKNAATLWAIEQETLFSEGRGTISGYTVGDAFDRYAAEISPTKKGERWEVVRLKKLKRCPLAAIPIERIQGQDVQDWIDDQTLSPGSVIRELNLIQSVIRHARKWRWTLSDPFSDLDRPKAPKHRDRVISGQEIALVLEHSGFVDGAVCSSKSAQVGLMFVLALETAMRAGEIAGMRWEDCYLVERYVHLPDTKNGKARDVPLSNRAVELLRSQKPQDEGRVFSVSASVLSALFRKIRHKAKLDGFTFHDARHTAVTRLARKLSVLELARMVGHSDPKMLMIYYNEHASQLASKLDD